MKSTCRMEASWLVQYLRKTLPLDCTFLNIIFFPFWDAILSILYKLSTHFSYPQISSNIAWLIFSNFSNTIYLSKSVLKTSVVHCKKPWSFLIKSFSNFSKDSKIQKYWRVRKLHPSFILWSKSSHIFT